MELHWRTNVGVSVFHAADQLRRGATLRSELDAALREPTATLVRSVEEERLSPVLFWRHLVPQAGEFDVMRQLAEGELETLKVETDLLAAALRLSVPPYPNASEKWRAPGEIPVHIDEADLRRLWPSGIRRDPDDGELYTAPTDGVIGCLVAHGTTLERAVPKLLEAARRIRIPQLQYRTDIGAGHGDKWAQLAKWNFPLPPTARKLLKQAPAPVHHNGLALGAYTLHPFVQGGKG